MIKKILVEGQSARAKLLKGALTVSRVLGTTLGPSGRNVIIYKAYSAPEIVNDGGTAARHIVLEDPIEDLGAQTLVEATMKTNDRAGDGRSTTAVIGGKLIEVCAKKIGDGDKTGGLNGESAGEDVIRLSREIIDAKNIVIEKLKSSARLLKKGELKNIISTSIGKLYPEYTEPIAEMVEKVGTHGYIAVEDNWGTKYGVETNTILGMRFLGSYITPVMITDMKKKESVWEDAYILVTNHRIESTVDFGDLFARLSNDNKNPIRKLIIIAEGFEREFTSQVAASYMMAARELSMGKPAGFFKILAVKAPSLTTEQFEDVATFCDAKFFDKNLGDNKLENVTRDHLGYAKKIIVDEDDAIITEGRGNVVKRIQVLNGQLDIEKDSAFKEQLKRRIGAMASGFGIIRVGAATETERMYKKKKIEDAVNAAKAAMEEGIVKGGGIALKDIADELGKDNVLYEALLAPYKKIRFNAGGDIKVLQGVVDSLKVTRLAVENACSVASALITCEVAIADERKTIIGELEKVLAPRDNEDFRDDSNQELKYRT